MTEEKVTTLESGRKSLKRKDVRDVAKGAELEVPIGFDIGHTAEGLDIKYGQERLDADVRPFAKSVAEAARAIFHMFGVSDERILEMEYLTGKDTLPDPEGGEAVLGYLPEYLWVIPTLVHFLSRDIESGAALAMMEKSKESIMQDGVKFMKTPFGSAIVHRADAMPQDMDSFMQLSNVFRDGFRELQWSVCRMAANVPFGQGGVGLRRGFTIVKLTND